MRSIRRLRLAFAIAALLLSCTAWSFEFVPTDAEFAGWPPYCQARYVTTYIGQTTNFGANYPQASINLWKRQLGEATFERVHHYCAGIIWLNRAKVQGDKKTREFYLRTAQEEALFTHRGLPPNSPILSPIYVTLAFTCQEKGDFPCAIDYLNEAIAQRPTETTPYCAMAVIHRKRGKLQEARDILVKGNEVTGGESAEIHYNLGLIYVELKDLEQAQVHAEKAYALGYPLEGLKKKLAQASRQAKPSSPQ